jgi:hypothetical protein
MTIDRCEQWHGLLALEVVGQAGDRHTPAPRVDLDGCAACRDHCRGLTEAKQRGSKLVGPKEPRSTQTACGTVVKRVGVLQTLPNFQMAGTGVILTTRQWGSAANMRYGNP